MLCVHVHQESFLIDTIQQKSFLQNLHNSSINRASFNDPYWSFTQYETFFHSINSLARSLFVWFRIQMQIYNKQQLQIELFLFFLLHLNDFFFVRFKSKNYCLFLTFYVCKMQVNGWMNEAREKPRKICPSFKLIFPLVWMALRHNSFIHYSVIILCALLVHSTKKREKSS